jgi:hypothetical protein
VEEHPHQYQNIEGGEKRPLGPGEEAIPGRLAPRQEAQNGQMEIEIQDQPDTGEAVEQVGVGTQMASTNVVPAAGRPCRCRRGRVRFTPPKDASSGV